MRRFNRVGTFAYEPLRIVGGPVTRAIIQRPPDIDRPGAEFTYPSPTLRVPHGSLVRTGQVVEIPGGDKYLVADHSRTIDWITHHLFRADRQVTWSRIGTVTDTRTGLEKNDVPNDLGSVWVMWEKVRREFTDLNLRVDQENHLVATGADVQEDDLIAGMTVRRVNRALGIKIVELLG